MSRRLLSILAVIAVATALAVSGQTVKDKKKRPPSKPPIAASALAVLPPVSCTVAPGLKTVEVIVDDDKVQSVSPPRVKPCRGDEILWRVHNDCKRCESSSAKRVGIGKRQGKGSRMAASADFLETCTDLIKPVGKGKWEEIRCHVRRTATPGLYKYDIDGDVKLDPEAEVQGGVSGSPPPPERD